ncbi:MAG TPA: tetratricopeptide repeat protein [Bryobacteraceae bacterium]|nr:tetratricopeptide repeat protein [Bryobacteraceae bacterium]
MTRLSTFLMVFALALPALAQQPGDAELNQAYAALAKKDYDTAISTFRAGLAKQPGNAGAHKDLAYTLLKTGDNAEARDEFEHALKVNARDETAALEFAFLAFETKKPIEARRMFDKLRQTGTPATRATAEQAFQNIDRPLASGIARWKEALARSANPKDPSTFSAHWELAQLAELRDELPLAAEQYEICRELKPQLSELLVILARVWRPLNRLDEAKAALLAASRSNDSRTAELALAQMDRRYPYPYEFVNALKLDPQNVTLRRELAYLYLAMKKEPEAIEQFEAILHIDPRDQAARKQLNALRGIKMKEVVPASVHPVATDAKTMGLKSFALGYTNDAIKYLEQAHEQNPNDAEVTLKLAWAYNQAKEDGTAIRYFDQARHADDPQIAAEATKAFHTLNGDVLPQTTVWALPMFSSRWKDVFTYGQVKRTVPLPFLHGANKFVSFYISTRFIGDLKSSLPTHVIDPQYLSESSFIFGAGASSKTWHHVTGWVEAGEAVKYLPGRQDIGTAIPDYRGGLNFAKGFGELLGSRSSGLFYETTGDAIYVSRFDKDWLFYSQHRAGRTFRISEKESFQGLFNVNYVRDMKNQYWANTVEMGPGIKVHLAWMPPNVYFATDLLRGVYTNNQYNPRRPNYNDVRVSFWYAKTK